MGPSRGLVRLSRFAFLALWAAAAAAQTPLRVTLPLATPMGERDQAGKPYGFVVDSFNAAAVRAGFVIDWRTVGDAAANNEALRRGDIDIVIGQSNVERRREFYISEPWWSSELLALVPTRSPIRRESDLSGRRLAIPGGAATDVAARYSATVVHAESAIAAVDIACSGYADAAVIATMYVRQLLSAAPPVCEGAGLRTIDTALGLDYVIIARKDGGTSARKLKDGLDSITADGTLAAIAARHPPVSTPHAIRLAEMHRGRYERQLWMIGMYGAGGLVLIAVFFVVRQNRARQRFQESEARFRALLDAAPQSVLAIDPSGFVVFANRSSREMFGRDVVGAPCASLVPARFSAVFRDERGPAEITALREDGVEFPAEIRTSPVDTRDQLTLAFITDISARVALQRQLLQSQKLESVGQLAGGVAHDFNNLLTVISGYAAMSLDQIDPEHYLHEPLLEISNAADRAAGLTRQLLAFSRRQAATPKLLSVRDLLHNLEKMLRRLIGEHIDLAISVADDVPSILADPGQIEQVVVNLVVNARDAMPDGGRITIRAELAGNRVILSVVDTGTGMTPEVEARIFEPFFTTKEQGKGTGLGLSTVYGIVKQAGGEIVVETAPGRGAAFRVILPAAQGSPDEAARAAARPGAGGAETILVAEDEPGVRRFVKDVLSASGYTVLEARNGREAVELAAGYNGRIHLLVTDLVMPEMGGIDLAERLKEIDDRAAVLYMSGYSERRLAPESNVALIEKPFTPTVLLERVREALKPPPGELPPPNRL